MEIKKVLVTGSEGYIGTVLVPILIKKGFEVTGLDTCYFGDSNNSTYTLIHKDVRDIEKKDLKGIHAIIHLAALSNDPIGAVNPKLTEEINFKASIRLARMAKDAGVTRFLFSSSCSVYGIAEDGYVDESSPVNPLTAYAKSKIQTETELQKLANNNFFVGLLRNSTVYGYSPHFRNDLVVNDFVTTALARGEIRVMSDGSPWRPLIDVRDLSEVFCLFLKTHNPEMNGNVVNIGFNENNLQVKDLLDEVHAQLPKCKIVFTGEHGSDTRSYKVRFDRLKRLLPELKQNWSMKKSIANMIEQLHVLGFNRSQYDEKKYVRIEKLKRLLELKKLDNDLRWLSQS